MPPKPHPAPSEGADPLKKASLEKREAAPPPPDAFVTVLEEAANPPASLEIAPAPAASLEEEEKPPPAAEETGSEENKEPADPPQAADPDLVPVEKPLEPVAPEAPPLEPSPLEAPSAEALENPLEEETSPDSLVLQTPDPVFFTVDSDILSDTAKAVLDRHIPFFQTVQKVAYILIEGNCDNSGTESYNLDLGRRRAEKVQNYLQERGILKERMKTVSYGENYPISDDPSRNRRVSFVLLL